MKSQQDVREDPKPDHALYTPNQEFLSVFVALEKAVSAQPEHDRRQLEALFRHVHAY